RAARPRGRRRALALALRACLLGARAPRRGGRRGHRRPARARRGSNGCNGRERPPPRPGRALVRPRGRRQSPLGLPRRPERPRRAGARRGRGRGAVRARHPAGRIGLRRARPRVAQARTPGAAVVAAGARPARADQARLRPEEPAQPGEEARPPAPRRAEDDRHPQLRLGLTLGYAPPGTNPAELVELAVEAEALGYDSAWTAEAWGTDAVTVLAFLAARTSTLKLGSGIMQIPARTPAMTAMTAVTLDLISGGRFLLGLGTSGPAVAEGWHG